MLKRSYAATLLLVTACASSNGAGPETAPPLAPGVTEADLEHRLEQFAPARIDFDASVLERWEKDVLERLVQASNIMHELFLLQVSPGNLEWRRALAASRDTRAGDLAYRYFDIMVGPWDRLHDDEPFLDVGPKPEGAGYYPSDLTRDELESWLREHPEDRQAFTGYFTVIERDKGMLVAIPYSRHYRERLERAAALLREAASISRNATLTRYLNERAASFLSNDYYPSDMAWMDIEGTRIEPTIGPYEVYEDKLFGYKAAFESFVTVADAEASAELDELKGYLRDLEMSLPIEDRYKNLERGFESPIRVVDVVYTAGDTRAGVQTIAFNLPNDERVREAKGSKKVMLRNVSQAKFDEILSPIAQVVLDDDLAEEVAFRPWFTNVLMHELSHGLGPGFVTTPSGERVTVNQALREHYSAMEEAKADVTGLHNLTVLAERGVYDAAFVRAAFVSHLADMFRATRFGAGEAHGKANLVQFNYLWDQGVIRWDESTSTFSADIDGLIRGNRELATRILTLQAQGDYDAASRFLEEYGSVRPQMRAAIERLEQVPVDIRPVYTVLDKMESW